jgi:hypothetical protein
MTYNLTQIDGETAYPIFTFSAKFTQKVLENAADWQTKDQPEGRQSNSTSSIGIFYKEEVSGETLQKDLEKWWGKTKAHYESEKGYEDIQDVELSFEYERNETWICEWFCHCTPDVGQSDEDALKSFQNYVYRIQDLNQKLRCEQDLSYHATPKGGVCLMGAEDRWRWRGENDARGVPCRCKGCKDSGIIRINH